MIHFQDHALLINESYKFWFGEYLVEEENPGEVLAAMNEAPMMIFTSDLSEDTRFNYGNVSGLSLFGCELSELIQAPVQELVPLELEIRQQLGEHGYTNFSSPIEAGNDKRSWRVAQGSCWQLKDSLGRDHGTGYCFREFGRI